MAGTSRVSSGRPASREVVGDPGREAGIRRADTEMRALFPLEAWSRSLASSRLGAGARYPPRGPPTRVQTQHPERLSDPRSHEDGRRGHESALHGQGLAARSMRIAARSGVVWTGFRASS